MAGETGEVSSIGVKLTLDAGEFMGGMKSAQGTLNTFQEQAARAGSGASQLKAGGGRQVASGPSSAQNLSGVNVSLTLNKGQLAELRTEITRGLGSIPVSITPQFAKSGPQSIQNIMGAMLSMQYGGSPAQGRIAAKQAIERYVPQIPHRASGGAVQQGQPVVVGEHRAEVFRPGATGWIEKDIREYRRRAAELAALEYQIAQGQRRMSGGWVIPHRAQAGPAHKGGLPRGYKIEFYSPEDAAESLHSVPSLDRPGGYYKPIKKPVIKGPRSMAGVVAVVTKGSEVVANFPFSFDPSTEVHGVPTPYGSMHPDYSLTATAHRRKGLATAAYVKTERLTGRPVAPSVVQLVRGRSFWAQPDRPFGKIFGQRPVDQWNREATAREDEYDRLRLEAERNFANAPSYFECPQCGSRANTQTALTTHQSMTHSRFATTGIPSTAGGGAGPEPPPYDAQGRPSFGSSASISQFSRAPIRDRLRARARAFNAPRPGYRPLWGQVERWGGYQPGETHELLSQRAQWAEQRERMSGIPKMSYADIMARLRGRMAGGPVERSFRVADPMGLHMRPSSVLAQVAQRYPEAAIQIRNLTSGLSPEGLNARSMMGWAQLMAIPGDEIGMLGEGENASLALHQLARLGGSPKITGLAKRRLKARWNATHAWRGATARAYYQTHLNEGGTFPVDPEARIPWRGHAIEIPKALGLDPQHIDPADPVAFMRAFHASKRAGAPYVGTWLDPDTGKIDIGPSTVVGTQRHADMVLRALGEKAAYDLRKTPKDPWGHTWYASDKRLRAGAGRINELIFGRRMAGGEVRRSRAWGITHAHGNIKGWENAQWRHQEMLEIEDRIRAARKEAESRRIPGFATSAWETFPLPAEPLVPLAGETGKLWGDEKRAGGPVHAKKGAVVGRMTQEELDFAGNLRAAAARISPDQMKFGKAWYADAQNWINEQSVRYGIDPTTVRGVTAALSAGTSWQANKAKAHRILQTHRMGLFGESFPYNMRLDAHGKARAILEGADPEGILGHTPKVGAFYRNLGGDLDALTLDRWAFRTATRGHLSAYGEGPVRNDIDAAYRQVAAELGLHPAELQAASWLYEKETNPLPKKGKPQSLGQLEDMFSPMVRRASGGAAVAGQPHGLVHPGGGMISQIFQTAADWANDPFMAIMSYQSMQQQKRAGGGRAGEGLYIVGEIGKELFVPNRLAHLVPKRVMDQIPKRASGGIVEIGRKRNELFAPPEDGLIIPNRLIDQIPHAAEGLRGRGIDVNAAMGRANDPRADETTEEYFQRMGERQYAVRHDVIAARPIEARRPASSDAEREIEAIEKAERMTRANEAVRRSRSRYAQYPVARENRGEELAVMRAGAGKTMPSRTPQGAIASIGSFLFGGVQQMSQRERERVEAASAYNRAQGQTTRLIQQAKSAHVELGRELKSGNINAADYRESMKALGPPIKAAVKLENERLENLTQATKKSMPTNAGVLRNLGVIIGATSAYGMAMQAASMVIDQAIIPAAGKMVDEFVGWTPTFTRVSTAMADTTRQMGGNYKAAVASAAATAGLSNETETWTEESLKAATTAKAGSKAFTEAKDLIAASMGSKIPGASNLIVNSAEKSIQMFTWGLTDASAILDRFKGGPAGAPQGLYGGYGGVGGTALFGEQLGGGSGFQQQITDLLKSTRQNNEPVTMAEVGVGLSVAGPVGAAVAVGAGLLDFFRGNSAGGPGAEYTTGTLRAAQGRAAQQEGVPAYGIRRTQGGEVDRLKAMGADKTVVEMAELGYVYTDSVGNLVANLDELNKAVVQAAKGMTIPDMGTWFKTITRQMVSQFQMLDIKSEINRTLIIPLEYATSRIAEPLAPPGTGLIPGALPAGRMAGSLPSFIGKAMYQGLGASERGAGWLADAARMQRELRDQNDQALADARARIVEMYTIPGTAPSTTGTPGVPVSGSPIINANTGFVTGVAGSPVVNPRTGFTTGMAGTTPSTEGPQIALWDKYIAQAKGYSAEIQSINNQIGTMSAILNQTQWANASRLAHRALADARDYWKGVDSQGGKSLGAVQKRLWDIGRAQTSLGLQLQQRAITTNLAVAQFQAPGETGEERYFRQKEAIVKAGIEQKQLDLGVKAFQAQGKEWEIVAQRNIKDLGIQADITEQQIALDKDRLAAEGKIAALTDKMGLALKNASDIFGTAESKFETGLGAASKYVETFGGTIKDALVEIWKGLGYTVTEGRNGTVNVSGSSGSGDTSQRGDYFPPEQPKRGTDKGGKAYASGYFGMVATRTQMTVGEAGPETIAVIRNARSVTMGGGVSDVKLIESSISAWVKAFTVAFPKVTLTDKSVKDIKDGFAVAAKDIAGTAGNEDAKKGGGTGQIKSYDSNMPKSERLDRFATALSKKTGLSFEASRKWAQAEVGGYNNLGIMTTNAQGKRVPMQYATPEIGAAAAAGLINSSSNYAGIRASTGGSTLQQLLAIANSPWHEGFKPGIDPYYKRIFGLKAQGDLGHTMGATPMIVGEAGRETVAILRNPRSSAMSGVGGTSGPVTININGPVVRNDQDISSLARQVAIEVERSLSRKGQMFGLRGPAV